MGSEAGLRQVMVRRGLESAGHMRISSRVPSCQPHLCTQWERGKIAYFLLVFLLGNFLVSRIRQEDKEKKEISRLVGDLALTLNYASQSLVTTSWLLMCELTYVLMLEDCGV